MVNLVPVVAKCMSGFCLPPASSCFAFRSSSFSSLFPLRFLLVYIKRKTCTGGSTNAGHHGDLVKHNTGRPLGTLASPKQQRASGYVARVAIAVEVRVHQKQLQVQRCPWGKGDRKTMAMMIRDRKSKSGGFLKTKSTLTQDSPDLDPTQAGTTRSEACPVASHTLACSGPPPKSTAQL